MLNALDIREGETGISVASAGDNTLAMLTYYPARIYAFDLNETQLFCCEIKMACFRCLNYRETLIFLGVVKGERMRLYRKLRDSLSEEARTYFDIHPEIIRRGIIHAGKFEHFFSIFRNYVIPLFSTRENFRQFAAQYDLDKQREFYTKHIDNRRLRAAFNVFFGYKVMGKLGRDESFYDHVNDKQHSGNDIRGRFEYGISNTVNAFNPYISYIVRGGYAPRCLPFYLRRENFDVIRENIDRITLVKGDLMSLNGIKAHFANLSDIFEYMSEEEFSRNEEKLLDILNDGGRAAYWNMQNRRYFSSDGLVCDKELSEQLFKQNNSWFYRDFLLYQRARRREQHR